MKIVVDRYIPYITETVETGWAGVKTVPLDPEEITADTVRDADVLIVRTRTRVDAALLRGSRVRLVCTATIGYDHIDKDYCLQNGTHWVSCPGCNAEAVADYVMEALEETYGRDNLADKTIGIIGWGHVGQQVEQRARQYGMTVLISDPPKGIGASAATIAPECDILTFHTPLTLTGDFPTWHMGNAALLSRCRPGTLIINAARGGVVDEEALLQSGLPYILDTWENEPNINPAVLANARQASYHIAGYSQEGKRRASEMCLAAISKEFGLSILSIDKKAVSLHQNPGDSSPGWLGRVTQQLSKQPKQFEQLRKNYILR